MEEVLALASRVRYVFFDVDGTLVEESGPHGGVWAKIHALAGRDEQLREERQRKHLAGELSYDQWMAMDIEDWRRAGVNRDMILQEMMSLRVTTGAKETVETLHRRGYTLGLVSSSIDIGIASLLDISLFEELSINRLFFDESGAISGWDAGSCRLMDKADWLRDFAEARGIVPQEIAYVGNDFNDIRAAGFAGVSFAVNCSNQDLMRSVTWVEKAGDMKNLLQFFPGPPQVSDEASLDAFLPARPSALV